ncbi:hypothetical protein Efla_005149 [Eimeria flavescens]
MGMLLEEKLPDDAEVSAAALRFYYENLFPFEALQRWLSYSNNLGGTETALNDPSFLSKREVCLTCRRGDAKDEEFFMRWQSFSSFAALKDRLLSMSDLFCHKLDFGGVYSWPVAQRELQGAAFRPQQKELVFDLDMNDYDDVRTCCQGKRVCKKCWQFLAIAARLLDAALREDFGFQHILWVFSGRRGLHAWVCDTDARLLPNESRGQLAEYLNICTGSDQQAKKIQLRGKTQHPAIERAFSIVFCRFHQLLEEQDLFFSGNCEQAEKLMEYLPAGSSSGSSSSGGGAAQYSSKGRDAAARGAVEADWLRGEVAVFMRALKAEKETPGSSSGSRLNRSVRFFEKICKLSGCLTPAAAAAAGAGGAADAAAIAKKLEAAPNYIKEIVLAIAYPRLDINQGYWPFAEVSFLHPSRDRQVMRRQLIVGLTKVSGCLPKALQAFAAFTLPQGRVCVPIDLSEVENFDPLRVPTLSHLRRQFDDPTRLSMPPKERTALKAFTDFFSEFFLRPLEQTTLQELSSDATQLEHQGQSVVCQNRSCSSLSSVFLTKTNAVFLLSTAASILRIRKTSSSSAFSNISDAALDLIPGVAFLHSMQIYGQKEENKWSVHLHPLSMNSRDAGETEYRLAIHDDSVAQRSSSSTSIRSNSSSSNSSSSSSSKSSNGTCKRRRVKETAIRATPWNAGEASLAALAVMFERQMQRRVSRRTAAAAAAAEAGDAPLISELSLPAVETKKFTLSVTEAEPIPASFSWLFKFSKEDYCLLLNTLYSAFSDKKNQATLFLTSSETDFKSLAGLLKQAKLISVT